jgi:hypothetical protein
MANGAMKLRLQPAHSPVVGTGSSSSVDGLVDNGLFVVVVVVVVVVGEDAMTVVGEEGPSEDEKRVRMSIGYDRAARRLDVNRPARGPKARESRLVRVCTVERRKARALIMVILVLVDCAVAVCNGEGSSTSVLG